VKRTRAFTLIELLVVIAIIALLISILLPSLSRARELSKRTVCSANLRGIGQAFYLYAQDDPGVFPAIAATTGLPPSTATDGQMQLFDATDRTTEPSTTGIPSPTVDMWAVVRANNSTPKQFICPSTVDTPDRAQDTTAYFDFGGAGNLSYGYQYQHDPNRQIIGTSSEPTFPVMADANPYVKGRAIPNLSADRDSSFRGNSLNHTNREGENVLFQDDHVTFEKSPDTGLAGRSQGLRSSRGRDNIYTTVTNELADVDPGNAAPVANPTTSGDLGIGFTGTVNLGSRSDACMVP